MIPQAKPGQEANEEYVPSPEELLALVETLQQQGLNMDQVPPDLKTLLDNVKRQKTAKGGAAPVPEVPTEEITPDPGFVIKTSEGISGRKVFINVCSSDRVPAVGNWSNGLMPEEVATALENMQKAGGDGMAPGEVEALRFPLACGPPRVDVDRKGAPCAVMDVVFNTDIVRTAAAARQLKAMLIEVATGRVAAKLSLQLDPRYKLPKMRYKGEVVASQRIRADDKRKKLVTELRDVDEEPSFALRTRKAAAQLPAAAAGPGPSSSGSDAGRAQGASASAQAAPGGKATGASAAQGAKSSAVEGPTAAAGALGGLTGVAPAGLPYKVEYEGRPVEWTVVSVELPARLAAPGGEEGPPPDVQVEVCGRVLYVRVPGHQELHVPMMFAAASEGASATCQQAARWETGAGACCKLVVRLPYRSLDEHIADARAQAPLAFGQLSFASKALLELEP